MGKDCGCCGKPCVEPKEKKTGKECSECGSDPCVCEEKETEGKGGKEE